MHPLQSCFLLMSAGTPRISCWVPGSAPRVAAPSLPSPDQASVHSGQASPQPRTHSHIPFVLISVLGNLGGTGVSLWDYRPSTKKPNGWHPLRDSRSSPAEDRPRRTLQRSQVRVSRTLTCTLSPWGRSYFRRSGWGTAPQTTLRSKGQGAVFHGPAIRCTLTLASKTGTDQLSDPR